MNGKKVRWFLRVVHLAFALLVGAMVYSPLGENYWFSLLTLYFFIPVLGVTGLFMWKQSVLMKYLKN